MAISHLEQSEEEARYHALVRDIERLQQHHNKMMLLDYSAGGDRERKSDREARSKQTVELQRAVLDIALGSIVEKFVKRLGKCQ